VDPRRLLARVARGELANLSFSEMQRLVEAFGVERYALSLERER
jgi:hypothetical protein